MPNSKKPFLFILTVPILLACTCSSATGTFFPTPAPTLPAPTQWAVTPATTVLSRPALSDGVLLALGSSTGAEIEAYDQKTGALKWKNDLRFTSANDQAPVAADGVAVVFQSANSDPRLRAFDLQTGQPVWDKAMPGLFTDATPAEADGRLYFENAAGDYAFTLGAFDLKTGDLVWESDKFKNWLDTTPLIENGQVFIAGVSGAHFDTPVDGQDTLTHIMALDTTSGKTNWETTLDGTPINLLSSGDGRIYLSTEEGQVVALDQTNGDAVWQAACGVGRLSPPTFANGSIYVGSADGNFCALDAASGASQWTYAVQGAVLTQPTVVNSVVYVGTDQGYLYALDSASQTERWNFRTPLHTPGSLSGLSPYYPPFDISPVADGNTLYVFNYDKFMALQVP